MTNRVLLNNIDHRDLRVITRHSEEFGDSINQALIFPTEFEQVQREYPILFRKDAEGEFQSVALLGLDKDENLFLDENGWQARYVPAVQQRGPFSIGLLEREIQGEPGPEPMIHVDLDDPRVKDSEGEPLFLQQGGNSPFLEHIATVLRVIYTGLEINKPMFAAFGKFDLIEPVALEIHLNDAEKYKVPNVYTIGEEKLARLEAPQLEFLHKAGFLRAAYFVLSSLANVSRLIDLKNRKRAAG